MSVHQRLPMQKALEQHLKDELAGQGLLPSDQNDPRGDVPIYRDVPEDKPQIHVRLDGFGVLQGAGKAGHIDRHTFMAHVFCERSSDSDVIIDADDEVARVQALVVGALEGWEPLPGACGIEHISSNEAPDEDPATSHGISKFKVMIGD